MKKAKKTEKVEKAEKKPTRNPRKGNRMLYLRELAKDKATRGLSFEKIGKLTAKKFPDLKNNKASDIRDYARKMNLHFGKKA